MKPIKVALMLTVLACPPCFAQTEAERQLATLNEQRNKALAAAVQPVTQRYKSALEKLLAKSTRANDLDTAVKIKGILERLNTETASSADPPEGDDAIIAQVDAAVKVAAKAPDMTGTVITLSKNGASGTIAKFKLSRGGSVSPADPDTPNPWEGRTWKQKGGVLLFNHDSFITPSIWIYNPSRDRWEGDALHILSRSK